MIDTYEQWCQNNTDITTLARALHSSTPEQYIGYYLHGIFGENIVYQKQFPWLGRQSIDFFIPTLNLALEYDGIYYHADQQRDKTKNSLCRSHGIRVVRIKEVDTGKRNKNSKNIIYYHYEKDYGNIGVALRDLCVLINKDYQRSIQVVVDLKQDHAAILSYVQNKYYRRTVAFNWPEVKDYWMRDNKKGIFETFTTDQGEYMLQCPRCGKTFVLYLRNFHNRRSLFPCECEYAEIENHLREVIKIYEDKKELPLFDDSLQSRRLIDRMASQVKYFLSNASISEVELYKKLGLLPPCIL